MRRSGPVGVVLFLGCVAATSAAAGAGVVTKIFITDGNTIQRMNDDGTALETIVEDGFDVWQSLVIEPSLGQMFWGDDTSGQILRANLDGSGVRTVVCGLTRPTEVAVDAAAGKVYWTDEERGLVSRANLDGTSAEDIVTDATEPHGVAVDAQAGKVYWTDTAARSVHRANLDGSDAEDLITNGLTAPRNIVLDPAGGRMYLIDQGDVASANLDGTDLVDVVSNVVGGVWSGLAIDAAAGRIFWVAGTQVRCANLDGSDPQTVTQGFEAVTATAVDITSGDVYFIDLDGGILRFEGAGQPEVVLAPDLFFPNDLHMDEVNKLLYWVNENAIYRANPNGSNVQMVLEEGWRAADIAVDATNGQLYWVRNFGEIWTADLDGGNRGALTIADLRSPRDIALDPAGGRMFWTETGSTVRLRRANLDGSNAVTIVNGVDDPFSIDFDPTGPKVYWQDRDVDVIGRVNVDGTTNEIVYPDIEDISIFALDVAGRRICWTTHSPTFSTQCGPIDGGAIVDLGVRGGSIEVSQVVADSPDGDANGDGAVDYADVLLLLAGWGPCPCRGPCHGDFDGDGVRGMAEILTVLSNWSR